MSAVERLRQHRRQSLGVVPEYSDPHGRDKIRLGQEMERDLGHYSFNNSTADSNGSPRRVVKNDHTHDYSMDYRGGDTDTGNSNDFFPWSPAPSTHDLSKHFRDFSMQAIDTSLESVEMPRGAGKEMGTPELDLRDFDRRAYQKRVVNDQDLSSQLHSPSSHGRSASLSDFGEMKRPFSPIETYGKNGLKHLSSDIENELKTASTPRRKQLPERPRSAFVDRYDKPSPPFQRPRNPVAKTMEKDYQSKPAVSTLPRSFKDSTQLFNDLGITTNTTKLNHHGHETPTRNNSFRLPDMTGIQSLINTTPKANPRIPSSPKYLPVNSIPVPKDEDDIIAGLRTLQNKVDHLTSENNHQRTRVRELETELRHQKRLYDLEQARANKVEIQMLRQSSPDSGFGSVGDSDEALERQKAVHAKEKMQFQHQLETLKSKITLLETLIKTERQRTRNLEEERDVAIKDMIRAQNEAHGMKSENNALKTEVAHLKKQLHNSNTIIVQKPSSAKERVKELVEAERKRDQSHKSRAQPDTEVVGESFIQPDEIEELRREIKSLRDAKVKGGSGRPEPTKQTRAVEPLCQTTKDAQGNIQTIRIQLENATDRKVQNGQKVRRRRIRRVIVESDASDDESDADGQADVTSASTDEEEDEEVVRRAPRSIPIQPWLRPPGQSKMPSTKSELQSIIGGLAKHNEASCTVCTRKRRFFGKKHDPLSRKPLHEVDINDITLPLFEGDSIRPSVPPEEALSSVLYQLKDEFHHLQLYSLPYAKDNANDSQYRQLTSQYEGIDPGRGKRKRKAIADKLREILEEFEAKADQIYALYDVVEGARSTGTGGGQTRRSWLEV